MPSIKPGSPEPLGVAPASDGYNVAVYAPYAEAVGLCLFEGEEELRFELPGRDDAVHHGLVPDLRPGRAYGFRLHGRWEPSAGVFTNPAKLLLDPYARLIVGELIPHPSVLTHRLHAEDQPDLRDSAAHVPRSVVTDVSFDWGDDRPPRTPWAETIIYEAHVRGMTMRHPEVPSELRGTYAGLTTPPVLDHLMAMGVTAIELLPVQFSVTEPWLARRGLTNYWGYSTVGFFAPAARYTATSDPVGEFKRMVRDFHKAGIEVLLDVVYNHTGEGDHRGPTLCYRGIDNSGFYRLDSANPARYVNWTGTGNTVDLRSPWALRLVMDSLRYWVQEMHVDGFRFDLATTLGRANQDFTAEAGFFAAVGQDPVLRRVKLIAEPWDLGPSGYRLGGFPNGWAEWNGRYRDDVRDFWRNTDGVVDELADRLTASRRIFGYRRPQASINFITSHDGFTLADLVSYNHKHNQANGEHNHDGDNDNRSWNSGHEGPTTDPTVISLRTRRSLSMLTTLFVSQGVPMLLSGDEMGRSQGGNNNAYCRDDETSWIDWEALDWELIGFVQSLARLRRRHPVFRQKDWLKGRPTSDGLTDVAWFTPEGAEMGPVDWQAGYARTLTVFLNGSTLGDDSFLIYLNGRERSHPFSIPARLSAFNWSLRADLGDTARPLSMLEEVPDFTVLIAAASNQVI